MYLGYAGLQKWNASPRVVMTALLDKLLETPCPVAIMLTLDRDNFNTFMMLGRNACSDVTIQGVSPTNVEAGTVSTEGVAAQGSVRIQTGYNDETEIFTTPLRSWAMVVAQGDVRHDVRHRQ